MGRKSKNQLRRKRAKLKRGQTDPEPIPVQLRKEVKAKKTGKKTAVKKAPATHKKPQVTIDMFQDIIAKFNARAVDLADEESSQVIVRDAQQEVVESEPLNAPSAYAPDGLTKRQFKKLYKVPLAILKAESDRPEQVEWTDADSADPRLLIYLKTRHNVVPIPSHWKNKRGFLSGRHGLDRHTFTLPKFIADTGILEMRDASEVDDSTLRQRMRERVQPKMGQLDMDFDKLYDAFFKYQTKPEMLGYGDVYEESMEDSEVLTPVKAAKYRPGVLSRELRAALGMSLTSADVPPWHSRLEVLGPPPAYPYMKIEGNGLIEVDKAEVVVNIGEPIDNTVYGKLEEESEEEEEEEEEDEEEEEEEEENEEGDVPLEEYGEAPVASQKPSQAPVPVKDSVEEAKKLYTVLKETESGQHDSIYGSESLAYDISGTKRARETEPESTEPSKKRPGKFKF